MKKTTLSLRKPEPLIGKARVTFRPERNDQLRKREEDFARQFVQGISNAHWTDDEDIQQVNRAVEALKRKDYALAHVAVRRLAMSCNEPSKGISGLLRKIANHYNHYHFWAVADVDLEFARYYRWWLDRTLYNITMVDGMGIKGPNKKPHISITRGLRDVMNVSDEQLAEHWGKGENEAVEFTYFPIISEHRAFETTPGTHYSITVHSPRLAEIRESLAGYYKETFHVTIGRTYEKV